MSYREVDLMEYQINFGVATGLSIDEYVHCECLNLA